MPDRDMSGRPGPPRRGERDYARPAPGSRLPREIDASRRARRQRTGLIITGMLSALVMLVSATAWGFSSYISHSVARVNAGTSGSTSGPLNILLAGVDLRTGLTPAQQRELHVGHVISANSDTMMLIHISASRSRVILVSLPRDSWVSIPGHGKNKINAAFGIGGPQLMVATVEHLTGLTINDYVEVNFLAFVKVIDALGGVDICLPFAINDSYTGLHLSSGMHHVNGITALKYARDRHSFATSDLARIVNQQSLLSSLLSEAISSGTLANPVRLGAFIQAVLGAVTVDKNMNVPALADQLRGIRLHDIQLLTVPLSNTNYLTPTGESAVLWNTAAAGQIFARLRADQPLTGTVHHRPRKKGSSSHTGSGAGGGSGGSGPASPPPGTRTASQAACH